MNLTDEQRTQASIAQCRAHTASFAFREWFEDDPRAVSRRQPKLIQKKRMEHSAGVADYG